MTRKTLLSESEIRRFMKLADMQPIGGERLTEWNGISEEEEEFSFGEPEGDVPMDEEPPSEEADFGVEVEEEPMDDMGLDAEEDAVELSPEAATALEDALGVAMKALSDALPAEVAFDVEGGEEEIEELPVEEPMGDVEELPVEEPMPDEEEAAMAPSPEMGEEEMVAEVARRVAARIKKESHKEKMAEQLAERIFNRIAKK